MQAHEKAHKLQLMHYLATLADSFRVVFGMLRWLLRSASAAGVYWLGVDGGSYLSVQKCRFWLICDSLWGVFCGRREACRAELERG